MSTYSRQSHANPGSLQHSGRVHATEQGRLTIMEESIKLSEATQILSKEETGINTVGLV
jgi:hypothetical protein